MGAVVLGVGVHLVAFGIVSLTAPSPLWALRPCYQGTLYGRRRPPPMASAASPPMTGGPYPLVR